MQGRKFKFWLLLMACFLMPLKSLFATSANRDMKNITMVPYADHMFLFYRCGDDLYFNHDIKSLRQEKGGSVTFNWYQNQTLIGLMYCDGFGFPFTKEKVSHKDISVTVLPEQLDVFYTQNLMSQVVRKTSFKKFPTSFPSSQDWSLSETLKDNNGVIILADSFQAFEFNGKSYLLYTYQGNLRLLTPEKKSLSFNLGFTLDRRFPIKAAMSLLQGKATLYAMLPASDHFSWLKLDLMGLLNNQFTYSASDLKFFPAPSELNSYELKAHLSGKVITYYVKNGEKSRAEIDVQNSYPNLFDEHKGFTRQFDNTKEDKNFDLFQMPLDCHVESDCLLVNFSYPKSADFFANPTSLLHATYGGKAIAVPLNTLPTTQEKMELIGIIEGPPPVPLENILSSFKVMPAEFVLDGARQLSRWIKTTVDQTMTFTTSEARANIKTTTHLVQAGGSIPTAIPITLSAMGQFTSKLMKENFVETTATIKKSFINEVQHARRENNKLIMKPIGKLIFLKYDLKAYRYVFKDENDKIVEDGPQLYSIAKTNYRPIIRPYEMIAKQTNPAKYPYSIVVGQIESYASLQRRRTLLDKSTLLAPGHNYLSYTFNNILDLTTEFQMTVTNRFTKQDSETVTAELGGGLGTKDSPVAIKFSVKSDEERTYTLANQKSEGMAINAEVGLSVPTEDPKVKSYDFEVFYLAPENKNANEILQELKDTQGSSEINKQLAEEILPNSKPWKVTYTVSDIRNAAGTSKGNDYGLPLPLVPVRR